MTVGPDQVQPDVRANQAVKCLADMVSQQSWADVPAQSAHGEQPAIAVGHAGDRLIAPRSGRSTEQQLEAGGSERLVKRLAGVGQTRVRKPVARPRATAGRTRTFHRQWAAPVTDAELGHRTKS